MRFTLPIFTFHKLLYTQCKNFFLEFGLILAFTFESRVSDFFYYESHYCLSVIFLLLEDPLWSEHFPCPIIP